MDEIWHSKKTMTSYGVGNIVTEILAAVLAVMLFKKMIRFAAISAIMKYDTMKKAYVAAFPVTSFVRSS